MMIQRRLAAMLQELPRLNLINLLIFHSIFWFSFTCITHIGKGIHHDMAENYAWGQVFEWGTFRHPPLIGWITGLWFSVFPEHNMTYFALSYFNVGIALWGIVRLAQLFQKIEKGTQEDFIWWVLALSVLTIAYATASTSRFNPNTLLLPLWPWTAYFFISSINYSGRYQYLTALGLGFMASLCMLGKYFSGVLLLSLFMISFSSNAYRRWYRTPYPYVSLLCMVVTFMPHVLWLYKMQFPSIEYMNDKMWLEINPSQLISFALSGFYFFILPWSLFVYFRCRNDREDVSGNGTKFTKKNLDVLALLVILPAANALVFAVIFHAAKVGSSFAYPIWFALPILLAALLKPYINQNNTHLLWRIMLLFLGGGLLFYHASTFVLCFISKNQSFMWAQKKWLKLS
ncbi:glycosyltransferase family 39 protein [uncultured Legionella sp.]|uniref:glycosyltransferase family 39 protein n=1 Tax=uncultured Legionella sp. TaxID=210934 RepID=UPI00260C2E8B|nr:glycosyltransferase family 39 protein [uncultured Legionella sp.]